MGIMLSSNGNQKLSNETFAQLRDLIYSKTGILFAVNKLYLLENRLKWRLEDCGCANYDEYLYLLKYDPRRTQEYQNLFNSVTTNETFFFRDAIQTNAFYEDVLPTVVMENEKAGRRELKVWSAASSTGEEAYTLAMQMMHRGIKAKGWKIEVAASDIDTNVLATAQLARYGPYAIKHVPPDYMSKYFSNSGDVYQVQPDVMSLVNFRGVNLIDSAAMRGMRNFDVIFCRNVLIYFDQEAKKKVIESLYNSLRPGGYLFIGYSESLHNISRAFKLKHFNKALVYQKEL